MDIRDIPAPPEADVIQRARLAARLSVDDVVTKVRAAGGKLSGTYLRDIERGHGGRRGRRVSVRASKGLLAEIAHEVGVTPAQLTEAGREDAAQVLEEMRRRENPAPGDEFGSVTVNPTEQMAADLDELLPTMVALAKAARLVHPDGPLAGSQVFPPSMPDAIWWWDYMAERGVPQAQLPAATAVSVARDLQKARGEQRQGSNAGLIRARIIRRRALARSP